MWADLGRLGQAWADFKQTAGLLSGVPAGLKDLPDYYCSDLPGSYLCTVILWNLFSKKNNFQFGRYYDTISCL